MCDLADVTRIIGMKRTRVRVYESCDDTGASDVPAVDHYSEDPSRSLKDLLGRKVLAQERKKRVSDEQGLLPSRYICMAD